MFNTGNLKLNLSSLVEALFVAPVIVATQKEPFESL